MLQNDVWNRVFELDGMAAAQSSDLAVRSLPTIRYRDSGLVNKEQLDLAPEYRGQSAVFGPLRISAVSQRLSFREEGVSAYTSEAVTKRQTSENLLGLLIVGTPKNGEEIVVRVGPLTNDASKKVFALISSLPAQDLTSMGPVSEVIDKILAIAIGERTTVLSNAGATRRDIVGEFRSALVPPVLPPRPPEPKPSPDLSASALPPAKVEPLPIGDLTQQFIAASPAEQEVMLRALRPRTPRESSVESNLHPLIDYYESARDVATKCRVILALLYCTIRGTRGENFRTEIQSELRDRNTPEQLRAAIARVLIHKIKSDAESLSKEDRDFILSVIGATERSTTVRTQAILALAGRAAKNDTVGDILQNLLMSPASDQTIKAAAIRASFAFSHRSLAACVRTIALGTDQALSREVLFAKGKKFNIESPHYWDLSRGPKGEVLH